MEPSTGSQRVLARGKKQRTAREHVTAELAQPFASGELKCQAQSSDLRSECWRGETRDSSCRRPPKRVRPRVSCSVKRRNRLWTLRCLQAIGLSAFPERCCWRASTASPPRVTPGICQPAGQGDKPRSVLIHSPRLNGYIQSRSIDDGRELIRFCHDGVGHA